MKKLLQVLFWLFLILAALGLIQKQRGGPGRARVPAGPGGSLPPPDRDLPGRAEPFIDYNPHPEALSEPEPLPPYAHIADPFWRTAIANAYLEDSAPAFLVDDASGDLVLSELGVRVAKCAADSLDRYGEHVLRRARLIEELGAAFSPGVGHEVTASVNGVHYNLETFKDSEILNEIYLDGSYRLALKAPIAIWDAGMDRGLVTVSFASNALVQRVVGFEANPERHAAARRNVDLNPSLSAKVSLLNSGIAARDGFLDMNEDSSKRSVPVLSAVSAFAFVQKHSPGLPVLLRLTGGENENEILPALAGSTSLHSIEAVVIEPHPYVMEMVPQLRRFGFQIAHIQKTTHAPGYLLASKGRLGDIFAHWTG